MGRVEFVFLVSRFMVIPGSSIVLGPCLFEVIRERGLGLPVPCMKLVENKISLIHLNQHEYCAFPCAYAE